MSTTQLLNQPTPTRASALALMAERCSVEPAKLHSTLKNTVFKGATDDELLALVVTANTYELNPLLKELYAFPKKGGGITPMVGVDGWLKIANRQPNFDGMEVDVFGDGKTPTHATCMIFLKDRSRPVKITEYFDECRRSTDPWNQMPRRMLRNKAMIQAIRVAFGIGGIHDEDEANDISTNSAPRAAIGREVKKVDAITSNPYEDTPVTKVSTTPVDVETVEDTTAEEPEQRAKDPTICGFFEKATVTQSSPDASKAWTLWEVEYTEAGGKCRNASTYSETLGAIIDTLEEGAPILLTIEETKRGDRLISLAKAGGDA